MAGNYNFSTELRNFTAFDNYSVVVSTEFDKYNKGDDVSITVRVKNVNDEDVKDFNLTLKMYNGAGNVTLVENQPVDSASYRIQEYDKPTEKQPATYYLYADINKLGNKGTATTSFLVYKTLELYFVTPKDGDFFEVNQSVEVKILVKNKRGNTVDTAKVVAQCTECERKYATLYPIGQGIYKNSFAFNAPETGTKRFSIFSYAIDLYKNVEEVAPGILLTTEKPREELVPPGVGAPGAPGAAPPILPANITPPTPTKDFTFQIPEKEVWIIQGENKTVVGKLTNKGEIPLDITIESIKKCCEISFPSKMHLEKKQEVSLPIEIHVSLTTNTGEYITTFVARSEELKKEDSFKIIVVENRLIPELYELNAELQKILSDIEAYRKAGVDVKMLLDIVDKANQTIQASFENIKSDDLASLRKNVENIRGKITSIKVTLTGLWIRKFLLENKWNITAGIITIILSTYFLTAIVIPYYNLDKEVRKLEEEEKSLVASRVETEKQYFLRKMDEKTFFTIMAEKQGKIMKVRADVQRKKAERAKLLISKLHPKSFALWLKSGAVWISKIPMLIQTKVSKIKGFRLKTPVELRYRIWKFKKKISRLFRK
jgi:hypothetical protein